MYGWKWSIFPVFHLRTIIFTGLQKCTAIGNYEAFNFLLAALCVSSSQKFNLHEATTYSSVFCFFIFIFN